MNPAPAARRGPDRVASQSGEVTRVVGQYAGARFAFNQH